MPEGPSIFLCSSCGWKKVCDPDECGLVELSNDSLSARKFRCPSCGRAVAPRKFPDPQSELNKKSREESVKAEYDDWMAKSSDFQRKFIEARDGKVDD